MLINYNILQNNALLMYVVRPALIQVAKHQVKTEIYITFYTALSKIPSYLMQTSKISILLNDYKFLKVGDDKFSVMLNFNGQLQYIEVPFDAITQYLDKANEYAIEFTTIDLNHNADQVNTEFNVKDERDTDIKDDKIIDLRSFALDNSGI